MNPAPGWALVGMMMESNGDMNNNTQRGREEAKKEGRKGGKEGNVFCEVCHKLCCVSVSFCHFGIRVCDGNGSLTTDTEDQLRGHRNHNDLPSPSFPRSSRLIDRQGKGRTTGWRALTFIERLEPRSAVQSYGPQFSFQILPLLPPHILYIFLLVKQTVKGRAVAITLLPFPDLCCHSYAPQSSIDMSPMLQIYSVNPPQGRWTTLWPRRWSPY